jgi:hypothetical protein
MANIKNNIMILKRLTSLLELNPICVYSRSEDKYTYYFVSELKIKIQCDKNPPSQNLSYKYLYDNNHICDIHFE